MCVSLQILYLSLILSLSISLYLSLSISSMSKRQRTIASDEEEFQPVGISRLVTGLPSDIEFLTFDHLSLSDLWSLFQVNKWLRTFCTRNMKFKPRGAMFHGPERSLVKAGSWRDETRQWIVHKMPKDVFDFAIRQLFAGDEPFHIRPDSIRLILKHMLFFHDYSAFSLMRPIHITLARRMAMSAVDGCVSWMAGTREPFVYNTRTYSQIFDPEKTPVMLNALCEQVPECITSRLFFGVFTCIPEHAHLVIPTFSAAFRYLTRKGEWMETGRFDSRPITKTTCVPYEGTLAAKLAEEFSYEVGLFEMMLGGMDDVGILTDLLFEGKFANIEAFMETFVCLPIQPEIALRMDKAICHFKHRDQRVSNDRKENRERLNFLIDIANKYTPWRTFAP